MMYSTIQYKEIRLDGQVLDVHALDIKVYIEDGKDNFREELYFHFM